MGAFVPKAKLSQTMISADKSKGQSFGPFCGENIRAKANLLVRFAAKT